MNDDCISRQAAIKAMYDLCADGKDRSNNPWRDNPNIDAIIDAIENLPSVQPVNTGKWVMKEDNTSFVRQLPRRWAECSCCGWSCDIGMAKRYGHCPDCGAKMEVEE